MTDGLCSKEALPVLVMYWFDFTHKKIQGIVWGTLYKAGGST